MTDLFDQRCIAILQSNYLPWKGYFDIIAAVDEFLIFDDVQFTRRDWRNRNRIVTNGALHWLTIPVRSKGRFEAPINEIEVAKGDWAQKHWRTLKQAYKAAPYFSLLAAALEPAYAEAATLRRLTDINELFLRKIAGLLGLTTTFLRTESIPRRSASATDRLIEICQARQATLYVSGPAAKAYLEPKRFAEAGISIAYANYTGYPIYNQGLNPFEHGVSIVDALCHCGINVRGHLKSLRRRADFLDPA